MKNYYMDLSCRGEVDLTGMGDVVPGTVTITRIIVGDVDMRCMGYGSELLKQVIDDADAEGIRLSLEINPYGPLDYDDLRDWYERYGFKESKLWPGIFVRRPGKKIQPLRSEF